MNRSNSTLTKPIGNTVGTTTDANITHAGDATGRSLAEHVEALKQRIASKGDLPHVSVKRQLEIVDDLLTFPFGQFLLDRHGANGFWADFVITYPNLDPRLGHEVPGVPRSPTEDFILHRASVMVAHRERFQIYQTLTQRLIKPGAVLASVPCGVMRDLLTLDYSAAPDAELHAIDIDPDSLEIAEQLAKAEGVQNVHFHQMDAWSLPFEDRFDVLSSCALNVYERDREEVVNLYKNFYRTLKPGGHLVCSVLTYPPSADSDGDWDLEQFSADDLLLEQIVFEDVLDVNWRNYRSISECKDDFEKAGFTNISVHRDRRRVFPTVLAQK